LNAPLGSEPRSREENRLLICRCASKGALCSRTMSSRNSTKTTYLPTYLCHRNHPPRDNDNDNPRQPTEDNNLPTSQGVPSEPQSHTLHHQHRNRTQQAQPSKHGPHPIPCTQHSPRIPQDYANRAARPHTTRHPPVHAFRQTTPTPTESPTQLTTDRTVPHRTAPYRTVPASEGTTLNIPHRTSLGTSLGTTLNIRTGTCMPERRTRAARRHGCATPSQPDGHACAPPTSTCCARLVIRLVRGKARHLFRGAAARCSGCLLGCLAAWCVLSRLCGIASLDGGGGVNALNAALRRVMRASAPKVGWWGPGWCRWCAYMYIYLRLEGHEIEVSRR
jgi:hypothetical protein